MDKFKALFVGAAMTATLCAAACGGSNQSPTTPDSGAAAASASPAPAPTPPGPSGATGSATINGSLAGMMATGLTMRPAGGVGLTVTITGTGISATAAPGGTFLLKGVPAGNVELRFTGGTVDDRDTIADVADEEQIHIVVNISGSRAIVNVIGREKPAHGTELEGLIASINLGARTLIVNGTTVNVPANAVIRHGDRPFTLADLKVGQRVHVKGSTSGSAVVASEVLLQDENAHETEAEAEGIVSVLGGACPSLTFTVHSTRVTTSASTRFVKSTCSQVTNGTKVEVDGTRQTDGSIKATTVQVDKGD